jgi:hypothetical protein
MLLAGPACGKKGDPQPPLRRAPQGPAEFELAQRGEHVLVGVRAPRTWSDGARLPVVELELLRADRAGEFDKVALSRRVRAAPGEAMLESEPAPAPGTRLRFAVRTRADGKQSPLSRVLTLDVQAPPPPPSSLTAARADGRVRLAWTAPAEVLTAAAAAAAAVPTPPPPEAAPSPAAAATPSPTAPAEGAPPSPAASGAEPQPIAPPAPKLPGFRVFRRGADEVYGGPLSKTATAQPAFDDETPPAVAICYVARTLVSSDPVVESADSNEACLPALAPQPDATPSAGPPEL